MEPQLFSRGNQQKSNIDVNIRVASMEPQLFSRGNKRQRHRDAGAKRSFNGAAAFQPRKYLSAEPPGDQLVASMEPQLFSRGNRLACPYSPARMLCFNGAAAFQPRKSGVLTA